MTRVIAPQWVNRRRRGEGLPRRRAARLTRAGVRPPEETGLVGWWVGDDVVGADASSMDTWPDRGPHGNDLTQATAADQPSISRDSRNGHSVVTFGGGEYMQAAADASLEVANPAAYLALQPASNNEDSWVIGHPHDSSVTSPFFRWGIFRQTDTSSRVLLRWDGTLVDNNATNYDKRIATIWQYWSLMDASFRLFGGERANGTDADVTYPNTVGLMLGANVDGSQTFTGDIAEVLLYDGSHTAAQREDVLLYLVSKYGFAA